MAAQLEKLTILLRDAVLKSDKLSMMQNLSVLFLAMAVTLVGCSKNNGFTTQQIDLPSLEDGQGGDGGDTGGGGSDGGNQGPPTTLPWSQQLGTFDSNCQNNPSYDACIFWKNPLAKQNAILPKYLDFGDDLSSRQTFGVKLQDQLDPTKLQSASIRVFISNVTLPGGFVQPLTNPAWKIPYAQETDQHWNAQAMTYFWLTSMEKSFLARTGIYYAKDKNIAVNAYNANVINNAYWGGGGITIGAATSSGSNTARHELALSAEVVLHEMGHANLSYAGGAGGGGTCSTKAGCMGAINEGQADFHYVMMFPTSTAMAETASNNLAGWGWQGISRDPAQLGAKKAADVFAASSGEIHTMGSLYAAILYDIYKNPNVVKTEFEKIFLLHLQKLTNSSTFLTGRDILLAEDMAHLGGKYQAIINAAFDQREF